MVFGASLSVATTTNPQPMKKRSKSTTTKKSRSTTTSSVAAGTTVDLTGGQSVTVRNIDKRTRNVGQGPPQELTVTLYPKDTIVVLAAPGECKSPDR